MKIRYGFVSNSSSSSFTCDICGHSAVVYDGGDDDSFISCVDGHTMCSDHVKRPKLNISEMREALIKDSKDNWDGDELERELKSIEEMDAEAVRDEFDCMCSDNCEIPTCQCPLCSFKIVSDDDLIDYLLMQMGKTKKDMIKEVTSEYENLETFEAAIKNHKKEMKAKANEEKGS